MCKDKRQYLLTLQVSRYCLLHLQIRMRVLIWLCTLLVRCEHRDRAVMFVFFYVSLGRYQSGGLLSRPGTSPVWSVWRSTRGPWGMMKATRLWHERYVCETITTTSCLNSQSTEGGVVKSACLEIAGSKPALSFKFQRNKMCLPCSLVKIQYCGEPPWPRSSKLGLRLPGFKFRIQCLEGSVISFISLSSGGAPGPV